MADSVTEPNEATNQTAQPGSSGSKQGKLVLQAPHHDPVTHKDQLVSLEVNEILFYLLIQTFFRPVSYHLWKQIQ